MILSLFVERPLGWTATILLAALVLDSVIGDPPRPTHPVRLMGGAIALYERFWRRFFAGRERERLGGVLMVGTLLTVTLFLTLGWLFSLSQLGLWWEWLGSVWLVATTVAAKDLSRAALVVDKRLQEGDLRGARTAVGQIVGRDTEELGEEGVVRATVETVAENTVDGLVSPFFYTLLFGVPGAVLYRLVNTLDSMVGYVNPRYRRFGWASARLDDLLNWLPARLTGIALLLIGLCLRLNVKEAWRAWKRDAAKHPSPNSGVPEAVVAGLLQVQLGGVNHYEGVVQSRAVMGRSLRSLAPDCIRQVNRLLWGLVWLLAVLSLFLSIWSLSDSVR